MNIIDSITPWDESTYGNEVKTLRVLVECEKGSVHKYEYDPETESMVIVRDLDKKYPYPFDYGCIPQTLAEDGDALDAIVVIDKTAHEGTLLNCKVIGIFRMTDNGEADDKILCVPFYVQHGSIPLKKITKFLEEYKYPYQEGTILLGFEGREAALEAISASHKHWLEAKQK